MNIARVTRSCESVQRLGINQPINSWTSIIFFGAVAFYLSSWTIRTQKFIQGSSFYSYLFIIIVAFIGISSFLAHGTETVWGGTADFESMYLLVTLIILLGINWFRPLKQKLFLSIWLVVNLPLTFIATQSGKYTDYTFMLLVASIIIIEAIALKRLNQIGNRYFWLSILSMALGYFVWQLDVRKIWCDPVSFRQAHSLWHLLTAVAAGLIYIYLATKPALTKSEAADGGQ